MGLLCMLKGQQLTDIVDYFIFYESELMKGQRKELSLLESNRLINKIR